jgi:hypothetical protein
LWLILDMRLRLLDLDHAECCGYSSVVASLSIAIFSVNDTVSGF